MNICVLSTTYPRYPGDHAGTFIVGQVRALAAAGHTVHVVAPHDPSSHTHHEESADGLAVHRVHYWLPHCWESLCYGAGIPENFRRNRLLAAQVPTLVAALAGRALPFAHHSDIVHGHWSFAGLAALIAGRLTGKPVVITMHGAEALAGVLRPLNRFLANRVDRLIVNSRFTRDVLRQYIPTVDPLVIPFGVNPEKLAPPDFDRAAFRQRAGLTPEPLVLAVGRLVPRKGFDVLLQAVSLLPTDRPVQVVIGGRGPEYERLRALAEALGLGQRVRLLGFVDDADLACWYAAADGFVLPAIADSGGDTEGLGVVLLEAMANGTPVVASNIGGITDIVRHGETGLLANPADPQDLAQQIDLLLHEPELRERLRAGALRHFENEFSWNSITHRLCKHYEKLIQ